MNQSKDWMGWIEFGAAAVAQSRKRQLIQPDQQLIRPRPK